MLDDPAVDHHRVHVAALRLEDDVAVRVEQREHHRRGVVLDQHDVRLLARLQAPGQRVQAERLRPAPGGPVDHLLGAQVVVGHGLVPAVGLQVLAGAVRAQRGPHGGEQVGAPPDAGVHRQRDGDAVLAQLPGGRVALAGALLALGGHRRRAAGRRDPVVGVGRQAWPRARRSCDGVMNPCSCMSRMPSSLVAPHTPAWVVTGTPRSRATSNAARSGNSGLPGTSKAIWKPSMSLPPPNRLVTKSRNSGVADHSHGPCLDVAVGEDEPPGHLLQRVHRGLRVVGGLQAVRPVHGGGHAGVDRLDRAQQVARVDVLRPERLAPLQVVPDEVLGERPVGAVAAHRRLPHVPVGVDHARHEDAAGRVDLGRALGHLQAGADRGDPLAGDQHVGAVHDVMRVVHGQHGRVAEHQSAGPASGRAGGRRGWMRLS